MKSRLFILLFAIQYVFIAQLNAKIDAGVSTFVYYEDDKPYVEYNVHIVSSSLTQREVGDNLFQAELQIELIITSENQDTMVIDQYTLVSPTTKFVTDFIDLRRYPLEAGEYNLLIKMTDVLNNTNTFELKEKTIIKEKNDTPVVSDIKLLSLIAPSDDASNPLVKYGYVLEPATFNFYHRNMNSLYTYFEAYNMNTKADSSELAFRIIENDINAKVVQEKKSNILNEPKIVSIQGFDITEIPSGNYLVEISLNPKNKEGWGYKDTIQFQRSNPVLDTKILQNSADGISGSFVKDMNLEELTYAIKGLSPRVNSSERAVINQLLKADNEKGMKLFLYNYWVNYDPVNTTDTYNRYMKVVKAVDKTFYSTYGKGFETDRGYVFLRYGKPDNVITVEDDPSAPPYEIWFYDRVDRTGQSNVKFLFYNPNLGAYHFELLHSTCRGERQNKQWELELYKKSPNQIDGNHLDATEMKDNFNRRAREYFEDQN